MFLINENNKFLKNLFFLSFLFLFIRSISAFSVFKFLESFDTRIFSYTDLKFYNESNLNIFSPNFIYAYLIKKIGYNSETLISIKFILISFILSFLVIIPFIFLSVKFLSKKNSVLFIIILSIHPYLSLYSLKLDSGIFATLGISFYSLWIFYSNNFSLNSSIIINVFSALFRNAIIPLIWMQFMLLFFFKRKFNKVGFKILIGLFLITLFITSSQFFYGVEYLSQNYGCYSYENINKFFGRILNPFISNTLSFIITPFVHMLLNLGAREAISIYCLDLPSKYASNNLLNIFMTFSFLFLHSFFFIRLLFYVFKNFKIRKLSLLFPFSVLLPTLYGTAHMRYLYPLLPLLIFMQFLPSNIKILKNL